MNIGTKIRIIRHVGYSIFGFETMDLNSNKMEFTKILSNLLAPFYPNKQRPQTSTYSFWRTRNSSPCTLLISVFVDPGRLNPIVLLTNGATALPPTSGTNIVPATGRVGLGLIDSLTKLGRSSLLSVGSAALGSGNYISEDKNLPQATGPWPFAAFMLAHVFSFFLFFSLSELA